jgi:hypothetical protein
MSPRDVATTAAAGTSAALVSERALELQATTPITAVNANPTAGMQKVRFRMSQMHVLHRFVSGEGSNGLSKVGSLMME